MKLKLLKMCGFKSFVEPTKIPFISNITGVVGPNGCGKSNVIDAVKWVLGESSAKNLRSESIADVIFTGSSNRKPAGQATVELIFDNSDGSLGGAYHSYSEISIKRTVNAEGTSVYYLNGTRCRRKNITDVFLGTGLGPRSYSIIEQGVISKFVEAKPEEMRLFIEEAAGISKYKERRKETNTKIKNTQENLNRINDLKDELGRQLEKIKRQANAAEKYKVLKEEEREKRSQLLALRWHLTSEAKQSTTNQINTKTLELESVRASKETIETTLVEWRENAQSLNDEQLMIQDKHYKVNSEIARMEESLKHHEERKGQIQLEMDLVSSEIHTYQREIIEDQQRITSINKEISELQNVELPHEDEVNEKRAAQIAMEKQKLDYEEAVSSLADKLAKLEQLVSLETIKIKQFRSQEQILSNQKQKLTSELEGMDMPALLKQKNNLGNEHSDLERNFTSNQEALDLEVETLSAMETEYSELVDKEKQFFHQLQDLKIKLATLEASISDPEKAKRSEEWLSQHGFENSPRLREKLKVQAGWEQAIEVVLGDKLQAICLDDLNQSLAELSNMHGSITFLNTEGSDNVSSHTNLTPLSSKIDAPESFVVKLLDGIYVIDSISEAQKWLGDLSNDESLVTKDGIWVHNQWVHVVRAVDNEDNIMSRQKSIEDCSQEIDKFSSELTETSEAKEEVKSSLSTLKESVENNRASQTKLYQLRSDLNSRLQAVTGQFERQELRIVEINNNVNEIDSQCHNISNSLSQSSESIDHAKGEIAPMSEAKEKILSEQMEFMSKLTQMREDAEVAIDLKHQHNLKEQTLIAELKGLDRNFARQNALLAKSKEKQLDMSTSLNQDSKIESIQEELESKLNIQLSIKSELHEVQSRISSLNDEISAKEEQRGETDGSINEINESLQKLYVKLEGHKVRGASIEEQISELELSIDELKSHMPEDQEEANIADDLQLVCKKIERLGPINLTAIDEFDKESERFTYYQQQTDDLDQALATLLEAMQKIDIETKSKFKDTFTIINENFKVLFPKLFGGGKAELYLCSKNLLDAGVGIVANPPGKKVTNISALSGGEKALTAVALVLSIFQLNPAPFCMLDEVDAPLDDANVLRFCEVIKEMSKTVQFIVITHNKLTMEMAEQLSGVTMQEPGVSRLVSVDIEEAINAA